LTEVATAKSTR